MNTRRNRRLTAEELEARRQGLYQKPALETGTANTTEDNSLLDGVCLIGSVIMFPVVMWLLLAIS